MVEHVSKGSKNVSFDPIDKETEYSTSDHISGPTEVPKLVFPEVLAGLEDAIIISFQVINFLVNLHEKRRANELGQFIIAIVDRKDGVVLGVFWQDIQVKLPRGLSLLDVLLKNEDSKVGMFGRDHFDVVFQ